MADTIEFFARLRSTPLRAFLPSVWYDSYLQGLPDLLLLRLPPELRNRGAEYKICITEDDADRRAAEASLSRPIPMEGHTINWRRGLDRVMVRASSHPPSRDFLAALYTPPEAGWPWLILTILNANAPGQDFARQRYAWDHFADEQAAQSHLAKMASFHPGIHPKIVTPL